MSDNLEYKQIEIDLNRLTNNIEKHLILEINNAFSKNDLYVENSDNKIIFNFKSLDLNKLKEVVSNQSPFSQIVEELENIKSYGLKAGKRVYVDYNKERKVKGRLAKVEERGIHYYANNNLFSKKNIELPKAYENQIVCGDSVEILKKLPDNCIDLVFTSPPYNFGLDYENHKDGTKWEDYFGKLFKIFGECIRVVKYGGRIVVNVQPLYSDYIPIHHIISDFFMKNKMIWRNEILWEKNNYNCKYTAWGSFKSPSSPYMKYTWEFLEVFSKGDLKKIGESSQADITEDEFKAWVLAKWSIAPERKMKEFGHPAMFPEKLAERTLKLFSFKNDIVLDPFNGLGTTTKVAKATGRKYLGIDISEDYCKKAERRLKEIL